MAEHRRKLEEAQPRRLRHRRGCFTLDNHRDLCVGREAIGFDDVDDRAKAIEQRRRADNELQLQFRVDGNRAHRGLDAAVVRTGTDEDADFSHWNRSESISRR